MEPKGSLPYSQAPAFLGYIIMYYKILYWSS